MVDDDNDVSESESEGEVEKKESGARREESKKAETTTSSKRKQILKDKGNAIYYGYTDQDQRIDLELIFGIGLEKEDEKAGRVSKTKSRIHK